MSVIRSTKPHAKVVVIGNAGVGKTSLLERFVYGKFPGVGKTLGASFVSKEVVRGEKSIQLNIWDTAGTERYRASVTPSFYRHAKAAVVCFDLTDYVSWQVLKTWVNEIKENEPNCKIVICATKKDLVDIECQAKRDVALKAVDFYAKSHQVPYVETSSSSGENVERLFSVVVDEIWDDVIAASNAQARASPRIDVESTPRKSSCCFS